METMVLLSLDDLRKIVREEVEVAVQKVEVNNTIPEILTRSQVMDLLQIGNSKAAELFGRSDFPVCREFGGAKVRKEKLFEWIDNNTHWIEESTRRFHSIS